MVRYTIGKHNLMLYFKKHKTEKIIPRWIRSIERGSMEGNLKLMKTLDLIRRQRPIRVILTPSEARQALAAGRRYRRGNHPLTSKYYWRSMGYHAGDSDPYFRLLLSDKEMQRILRLQESRLNRPLVIVDALD